MITADWSPRVILWESHADGAWTNRTIYQGQNPIFYAEPAPDGSGILMVEWLGGGYVRGFYYLLAAREELFDLGSEYKWWGSAFTEKGDIAISSYGKWQQVLRLPSLSSLAAEGAAELSAQCSVADQDYRKSPCWPAEFD